jgi:hypothetical protein
MNLDKAPSIFGAISAMCNTVGVSTSLIGSKVHIANTRSQGELDILCALSHANPAEIEKICGMTLELKEMPAPMVQILLPQLIDQVEEEVKPHLQRPAILTGRGYVITAVKDPLLTLTPENGQGVDVQVHKGLLTLRDGVALDGETGHKERYHRLRELAPLSEMVMMEIDDTWGSVMDAKAVDLFIGKKLSLRDVPQHDRRIINHALNVMTQLDARVICDGLGGTSENKNYAQMSAYGRLVSVGETLREQMKALATPIAVDLLSTEWEVVSILRDSSKMGSYKNVSDEELHRRFRDMKLRATDGTTIELPSGVLFYKGATIDGQLIIDMLN